MVRSASSVDGGLKPLIRQALREDRITPPLDPDSGPEGYLRVSSFAGLCAREEALRARMGMVRQEEISADLSLIFEHGDALHWDLQNRILPKTQTILGRWACASCGHVHGGRAEWVLPLPETFSDEQLPRPERCPSCGAGLTSDNCLFQEQWIIDPVHRLAGHPDGFLRIEGLRGLGLLEGKSINPKGAQQVRGCPNLDHVVQLMVYMWMTGCRWGKILYWDKAGQGISALIEHHIDYDDDQVEAIQNLVEEIWTGVRDKEGKLSTRICTSVDCKRAELCSVAVSCFKVSD